MSSDLPDSNVAVAEVFALFETFGSSNYDEGVTLADHSLQTAALASAAGASAPLVVAALLHDVGHLLRARELGHENYLDPDWAHDTVAADWLRPRFGHAVADPVRHHVSAKRWLCACEPEYFTALSAASKASLTAQGGPFGEAAAAEWRAQSGAADAIRLRRWDDDGKTEGLAIAPFDAYTGLLCAAEDGAK